MALRVFRQAQAPICGKSPPPQRGVPVMFGMDALTFIHVLLSLIGIVAGFAVLVGMFDSRRMESWTALFLITTVATSVTGFFFPFTKLLPSHIVGIISLVV